MSEAFFRVLFGDLGLREMPSREQGGESEKDPNRPPLVFVCVLVHSRGGETGQLIVGRGTPEVGPRGCRRSDSRT